MDSIKTVIYEADSGSVLPEQQWHVRYDIDRTAVTLTRNGRSPSSVILSGSWKLAADTAAIEDFFRRIEAVDIAAMRRVEPADIPDGGGAQTIALVFASGKRVEFDYPPGVFYANGEELIATVRTFIRAFPCC